METEANDAAGRRLVDGAECIMGALPGFPPGREGRHAHRRSKTEIGAAADKSALRAILDLSSGSGRAVGVPKEGDTAEAVRQMMLAMACALMTTCSPRDPGACGRVYPNGIDRFR